MPLTMRPLPASTDLWGVSFQMSSASGTTIYCRISRAALEMLAGRQRDLNGFEQGILFDHWQSEIERLANRKYDAGTFEEGLLLIEPEDLADRQVS